MIIQNYDKIESREVDFFAEETESIGLRKMQNEKIEIKESVQKDFTLLLENKISKDIDTML